MDAAKFALDLPCRRFYPRGVGNVERQGESTHAQRRDLLAASLDVVAFDIGECHLDPGPCQSARDPQSDAVRRAGDEGELPSQLPHLLLPCSSYPVEPRADALDRPGERHAGIVAQDMRRRLTGQEHRRHRRREGPTFRFPACKRWPIKRFLTGPNGSDPWQSLLPNLALTISARCCAGC